MPYTTITLKPRHITEDRVESFGPLADKLLAVVKHLSAITLILCSLVAAVVVISVADMKVNGRDISRVQTGSMEPTIMVGQYVISKPAVGGELTKGAVITVQADANYGGLPVTHRIIDVAADGTITTQGDANPGPDEFHPKLTDVKSVVTNVLSVEESAYIYPFLGAPGYAADAVTSLVALDFAGLKDALGTDGAPFGTFGLIGLLGFTSVLEAAATAFKKRALRHATDQLNKTVVTPLGAVLNHS